MNFLIKFHKNPVGVCCVCMSVCLYVLGGGNSICIDEGTEDLKHKCFLESLFESPKGKVPKINEISLFITALCHLANN